MVTAYTVGTCGSWNATQKPARHCFYAKGRHWVFWVYYSSNDSLSELYYNSSVDGITWGSASKMSDDDVGWTTNGRHVGIWYDDGGYVLIAYYSWADSKSYFRRGLLNSDGTITWGTKSMIYNGQEITNVSVCCDSNYKPFVGYKIDTGAGADEPYVAINDQRDGSGSWTITKLRTGTSTYWTVMVVQLTGGKMFALYTKSYGESPDKLYGKLYNGVSWGSEEQCSSENLWDFRYFDAVGDKDDIHLIYVDVDTPHAFNYRKRDSESGTWQSEVELDTLTTGGTSVAICLWATNHIRAFWRQVEYNLDYTYYYIDYKDCKAGTWDASSTRFYSTSTNDVSCISCFAYTATTLRLGVTWTDGDNNEVKYGSIDADSVCVTGIKIGDITIGCTDCERILEFNIGESVDFAIKPILDRKTPTIEGEIFVTSPKIYKITARVGKIKRDSLQTEKDNHETLTFIYDLNIMDNVKFEEFEYRWAGQEEHNCPWLVTITLVSTQH